jgi:hypothetical protein
MAGVLVNTGEDRMLGLLVAKSGYSVETLTLKLYKSNTTPAETSTAGDFTESTFTGYAAINLVTGDWTLTPGAPSSAGCAQKTFSSSANQATEQCYGYLIIMQTAGTLVAAERFSDGPYPIANNGDQVKITATITQD